MRRIKNDSEVVEYDLSFELVKMWREVEEQQVLEALANSPWEREEAVWTAS